MMFSVRMFYSCITNSCNILLGIIEMYYTAGICSPKSLINLYSLWMEDPRMSTSWVRIFSEIA